MYAIIKLTPEIKANFQSWCRENKLVVVSNFLVKKDGFEDCFGICTIPKARHILNCATKINE